MTNMTANAPSKTMRCMVLLFMVQKFCHDLSLLPINVLKWIFFVNLFSLIYKNYYFAPKLKWEGMGHYIIIPEYKYDHDGDTIYTDIYQKEVL